MTYKQRLETLRKALPEKTAFLVPRTDVYQGEYIRACDERLAWLTGFTGSAGCCLVLPDVAYLFVDGRYTLQARQQVDTKTYTIIDSTKEKPTDYIENMPLAVDPWLFTIKQKDKFESEGITLTYIDNPVDQLWTNRPTCTKNPVYPHNITYTGETTERKIQRVLATLDTQYDALLLTKPESINWLLNIRGSDIPHTPVALCYGVLHREGTVEVTRDIPEAQAIEIDDLPTCLHGKKVATDFTTTPVWFAQNLPDLKNITDPCEQLKACKNETEITGMQAAHLKDGVAVCTTFAHVKNYQDELDVIAKLEENRAKQENFKDSSFQTIAGIDENGAIIHYRATPETSKPLTHNCMILIDSGGQYLEGTTDITRTLHTGQPTEAQQRHYTLVLKGLVAMSTLHWPSGLAGRDIDAIARSALWREGLDYAHGTGHGVGSFLSVHEGPQSLSKRNTVPLKEGMVLSIEPGFYLEGHYGIRLENLVVVTASPFTDFLTFETLTLCPFERKLIDQNLLNEGEKVWINTYHKKVFDTLNPHMSIMHSVWLSEACAKL